MPLFLFFFITNVILAHHRKYRKLYNKSNCSHIAQRKQLSPFGHMFFYSFSRQRYASLSLTKSYHVLTMCIVVAFGAE